MSVANPYHEKAFLGCSRHNETSTLRLPVQYSLLLVRSTNERSSWMQGQFLVDLNIYCRVITQVQGQSTCKKVNLFFWANTRTLYPGHTVSKC